MEDKSDKWSGFESVVDPDINCSSDADDVY